MTRSLARWMFVAVAGMLLCASLAGCSASQPSAASGTPAGPVTAPSSPAAPLPTAAPSASPTQEPSTAPSSDPSPSVQPSVQPSPSVEPSPSVAPSPSSPPSPSTPPGPSSPPSPSTPPAPEVLRVGAKGPEVEDLQRQLASMGYFVFPVDGVFGDDTLHAVIAFQKANRIGVDGAVGPETRAALKDPAKLVPQDTSPGRHVEVDIDRQILMFVYNGQVTHVFDTSTGGGYTFKSESGDTILAHTPRGHFTIERKIDGDHTSYLGEMWRPSYFYGGYAIHGDSSVPTYPASHGCVRLTNDVTDWAFDRLPIGTPVYVYPAD